jgi:hypothetical protein
MGARPANSLDVRHPSQCKESDMSHFRRPGAELDRHSARDDLGYEDEEVRASPTVAARASLGEQLTRVSRWFQGLDVEPEDDGATVEWDPIAELGAEIDQQAPARSGSGERRERPRRPLAMGEDDGLEDGDSPFPLAPFGYNRMAVDERIAALEAELQERDRELAELREAPKPPMSIAEELERIGEQTASILVVAHDQAHETTRRAHEQAERCIADAAANAVQMTAEAKQKLRELDDETDAVWRERQRLLEDTRAVSARLTTLVEEAMGRFPADGPERPAEPVASEPRVVEQPPAT